MAYIFRARRCWKKYSDGKVAFGYWGGGRTNHPKIQTRSGEDWKIILRACLGFGPNTRGTEQVW